MAQHMHPGPRTTANTARTGDPTAARIDAKALGSCRRAVAYCLSGTEPQGRNKDHIFALEAERALTSLGVRTMRERGWTIRKPNPGDLCRKETSPGIQINGLPDAIAKTEGGTLTGVTVRVDWNGDLGNEAHAMRAAFCHMNSPHPGVSENPAAMCIITAGARTIRCVDTAPEESRETERAAVQRMASLAEWPERMPERDFERGSPECMSCPWFTPCRTRRDC